MPRNENQSYGLGEWLWQRLEKLPTSTKLVMVLATLFALSACTTQNGERICGIAPGDGGPIPCGDITPEGTQVLDADVPVLPTITVVPPEAPDPGTGIQAAPPEVVFGSSENPMPYGYVMARELPRLTNMAPTMFNEMFGAGDSFLDYDTQSTGLRMGPASLYLSQAALSYTCPPSPEMRYAGPYSDVRLFHRMRLRPDIIFAYGAGQSEDMPIYQYDITEPSYLIWSGGIYVQVLISPHIIPRGF